MLTGPALANPSDDVAKRCSEARVFYFWCQLLTKEDFPAQRPAKAYGAHLIGRSIITRCFARTICRLKRVYELLSRQ